MALEILVGGEALLMQCNMMQYASELKRSLSGSVMRPAHANRKILLTFVSWLNWRSSHFGEKAIVSISVFAVATVFAASQYKVALAN